MLKVESTEMLVQVRWQYFVTVPTVRHTVAPLGECLRAPEGG